MKYLKLLIIISILLSADNLLAESCPVLNASQAKGLLEIGRFKDWTIEYYLRSGKVPPRRPSIFVREVSPPLNSEASVSKVHDRHYGLVSMYTCQYNVKTSRGDENVTIGKIAK